MSIRVSSGKLCCSPIWLLAVNSGKSTLEILTAIVLRFHSIRNCMDFYKCLELKDAVKPFQRVLVVMFSSGKGRLDIIYLYEIDVFLRAPCDQINYVKHALSLLQNAKITLKLKKCNMFTKTIEYLDYNRCSQQSKKETHTTKSIKEL